MPTGGHTPEQAAAIFRAIAEPAERLPASIGPFRILRLLGRGGMGTVYEAEQPSLGRRIALKVIRPGVVSRETLARFAFEARVLSRLRHPNIAAIHDAGEAPLHEHDDPLPYYAMELVEHALPIHRYADEQDLDIRQRIELLLPAIDAVHHGHQHGVIHRDLKPDNILVGTDGVPKIIDFGIASSILPDPDASLAKALHTDPGALVGSLQFIAPEQLDSPTVDVRADVYALGLVTHLLACGRLPYDLAGKSITQAAKLIQSAAHPAEATDLRTSSRPICARSLRAVLARSMELSPDRRYVSAAALAHDLRALLERRPVSARPPSLWRRLSASAARHPIATTGIACAAIILSAAIGATLTAYIVAVRPHAITIAEDQRSASIVSRVGWPIRDLPTGPDREFHDAVPLDAARPADRTLLRADIAPGQTLLQLLDLTRPETPIWRSWRSGAEAPRPAPSDLPLQMGFAPPVAPKPARVFPTSPGHEFLAVLNSRTKEIGAVGIHDRDGKPLAQLWSRGHLADVNWNEHSGLLFISGWLDPASPAQPSALPRHTNARTLFVCAVRPGSNRRDSCYLDDLDQRHEHANTLIWYATLPQARREGSWLIDRLAPPRPGVNDPGGLTVYLAPEGADRDPDETAMVDLAPDGLQRGPATMGNGLQQDRTPTPPRFQRAFTRERP